MPVAAVLISGLAFASVGCSGATPNATQDLSGQSTSTDAYVTRTGPARPSDTKVEPTKPADPNKPADPGKPTAQTGVASACPADLSGLLTAPLMDPKYISGLIPLGNVNPPGHTSPVDHIYFDSAFTGKIPLYAPADSAITRVIEQAAKDAAGKYNPNGFTITYTLCPGVHLDLASYTGVSDSLTAAMSKLQGNCVEIPQKPGHTDFGERQCSFDLDLPVKAGDEMGWVQLQQTSQGPKFPFEVWASNDNVQTRTDVDWTYYLSYDNYYPHAVCLFDLYSGSLKTSFYAKFGLYENKNGKTTFTPRTVAPQCGQINQDVVGAVQGMWFAGPPDPKHNYEFEGKGLAFIHYNIDPTRGEISVGGNITPNAGVVTFTPKHSGTVDREPSEVKADGLTYCYNASGWGLSGKILVQLTDEHHLQVEHQSGTCSAKETLKAAITYQR